MLAWVWCVPPNKSKTDYHQQPQVANLKCQTGTGTHELDVAHPKLMKMMWLCGCKADRMVRSSGNPASQQVCLAPYSTQAPWELWTEIRQQLMQVRLMTRNKWHSSLRLPLFYWLHNYVLAIMQFNLNIITCVLNISFVYRVIFLPLFGPYYLRTNDNTRSQ